MSGRRGRKKGEGIGRGAVQQFVKRRGGRRFVLHLYEKFVSADAVAEFLFRQYNFYCSGNTIRNLLRYYHVPLRSSGGDRRSTVKQVFLNEREKVFDEAEKESDRDRL